MSESTIDLENGKTAIPGTTMETLLRNERTLQAGGIPPMCTMPDCHRPSWSWPQCSRWCRSYQSVADDDTVSLEEVVTALCRVAVRPVEYTDRKIIQAFLEHPGTLSVTIGEAQKVPGQLDDQSAADESEPGLSAADDGISAERLDSWRMRAYTRAVDLIYNEEPLEWHPVYKAGLDMLWPGRSSIVASKEAALLVTHGLLHMRDLAAVDDEVVKCPVAYRCYAGTSGRCEHSTKHIRNSLTAPCLVPDTSVCPECVPHE